MFKKASSKLEPSNVLRRERERERDQKYVCH